MIHTLLRKSALTVPVAAIALAVSSACAAPVGPSDASFYTKPATAPSGKAGDLIQYRPTSVKLGAGAPATQAWNVLYQSTDSLGKPNYVSGTVIVPTTAASGGPRQVVIYAVGTHGLAQKCAPSRQFENGTDYEAANMVAALKAGYAVLVSDYEGYLTGSKATYLAGKSQAQAVLDLFRASQGIPSVGFTASSKVGIWGFSQGGQTAAWAGEILSSYAPEVSVVGVAAGGIPGNFQRTAHNLDGNLGAAFLGSAVSGLGVQYPNTIGKNFNLLVSPAGRATMAKLESECVFEALLDPQVINHTLASFTNDSSFTLDDIIGVPAVDETLTAQNLGTKKINVPLYQFHGTADEFIPLDQTVALKKAYCANGTTVAFDVYPGEHIMTMTQSAAPVLTWLADRFAGKTAPNTCNTAAADPVANPKPGGGNFVVGLNKWKLDAKVHLKTLNQDVPMPATSTLQADADITAKTLKGQLSIPEFKQTINLIGLPLPVGLKISPAGDVNGTTELTTDGILHVHGTAPVNITVTSVLGIPFGECKTISPVNFPLNFDGPVALLGNGGLSFSGTATFPQVKGCFISAILTALMSGSGQTYNFTVSPPAPVKF